MAADPTAFPTGSPIADLLQRIAGQQLAATGWGTRRNQMLERAGQGYLPPPQKPKPPAPPQEDKGDSNG